MFAFFGLGMQEIILLAAVGSLMVIPVVVVVMIRAFSGSSRQADVLEDDDRPRNDRGRARTD
jgi:hypothetical protein